TETILVKCSRVCTGRASHFVSGSKHFERGRHKGTQVDETLLPDIPPLHAIPPPPTPPPTVTIPPPTSSLPPTP
ncbi:hypothetical protein TSAR_000444, partial [Trichomalopsis sarcophagae]